MALGASARDYRGGLSCRLSRWRLWACSVGTAASWVLARALAACCRSNVHRPGYVLGMSATSPRLRRSPGICRRGGHRE